MRKLFGIAASAMLVSCLAGCGSEPEAPIEVSPDAPEGISVSAARLNLPAASGNPAAVYFTITNSGSIDQVIRAAHVQGADSAQFHKTIASDGGMAMQELLQVNLPAGESVSFEPGGRHVMVFGLPDDLEVGGELEVTLSFAHGDKVSFPARLLAPGDNGSMMEMGK